MKMTKNILTFMVTWGLFLVPFIPFVVGSKLFFPFISGKGFIFRILIEVLFGLYAYLAVIEPAYRPKSSWITKSIGIFAVVILIADIFGANAYKSLWSNYERMEGFISIFHLVLYYIVASSVFNARRWNQFWNVSIVASVLMSGYGVLQLLGKATINQGGVRLDATFGNSAYLAIYLVFHIFLCLYMIVQMRERKAVDASTIKVSRNNAWMKWVYAAIAVLETVVLYYTATRGSILGLMGGFILAALLLIWKEREDRKIKKTAYGFLLLVLVLVGGFYALRNSTLVAKSPVLSRFVFNANEIETQGRYYVWPMAVKGFVEHPILGWGQENFNFVFNKYYDARMYGQEQWFDRTHDVVLDWLIAGGLLGLLAYVGMFVALFYYIWRRKSLMTVAEKSILTGLIAAYVFHNIFVFDNIISYVLFFSVLGFVHSVSLVRREDAIVSVFGGKVFKNDTSLYLFAPVIGLATLFAVYFLNVPAIFANTTLIQAISPQSTGGVEANYALFKKTFAYNSYGSGEALEQLIQVATQIHSSQQIPDASKKEFYDLAVQKINEKLHQTPNDARYLLFAGSFYNAFGQFDAAIPYLISAVKNSPTKQTIYFELGTSYIGKRDYQKAFDTFQTAYNIEPANPDAKVILAVGAIYTKNSAVLQKIFTEIPQATIINDNRLLQSYAGIGDYQSVISILTLRIQKDPTNLQYQLSLASAYLQIGQKQKAIDIILAMEKENPQFKAQGDSYITQIQNSK